MELQNLVAADLYPGTWGGREGGRGGGREGGREGEQRSDSIRSSHSLHYFSSSLGVDLSVLRDVLDAQSFDKILSFPEFSRFIDQDPYLAKVLRTPK